MKAQDNLSQYGEAISQLSQDIMDMWPTGASEEELAQITAQWVKTWRKDDAMEAIVKVTAGIAQGAEIYKFAKTCTLCQKRQKLGIAERIRLATREYTEDAQSGILYAARQGLLDALEREDSESELSAYASLSLDEKRDYVAQLFEEQAERSREELLEQGLHAAYFVDNQHTIQETAIVYGLCTYIVTLELDESLRGLEEPDPEQIGRDCGIVMEAARQVGNEMDRYNHDPADPHDCKESEDGEKERHLAEYAAGEAAGIAAFAITANYRVPILCQGAAGMMPNAAASLFGVNLRVPLLASGHIFMYLLRIVAGTSAVSVIYIIRAIRKHRSTLTVPDHEEMNTGLAEASCYRNEEKQYTAGEVITYENL